MQGFWGDIRHAFRIYRRTPGASLIALVALIIGMAFVGAFMSLYVDLVLRPHPGFEQSGRIVTIGQTDGRVLRGLSVDLIDSINEDINSVESIAGVMTRYEYRQNEPGSEPQIFEVVTSEFFDGLRPRLALGRGFGEADHTPESEPVTVISHRFWREQLDADPDVLGTTYELEIRGNVRLGPDGPEEPEPETLELRIVGVMAPEMTGVSGVADVTLWLPFERMVGLYYAGTELSVVRRGLTLTAFARRASGASPESIVREITARYESQVAELNLQTGYRFDAIGGVVLDLATQRDVGRQLRLFLAGSVLLALVAACNVSLFLLARAPGRRRELAIRLSVGAPIGRLGRQLATEAGTLVIVAAVLGLALSVWLSVYLRSLAFLRQAQFSNVTLLDWRVLSLVGSLLLVLTIIVSLAPVLGLRRIGIAAASRQVAARATPAQRIAGTAQVAIAGTLAGAAVAFAWHLAALEFGHPGYETRNLYTAQFGFNLASLLRNGMISTESLIVENARRREGLESVPGITAVALGSPIPGSGSRSTTNLPHPLDTDELVRVHQGWIDSNFVDLLGLRLLHGRAPNESDIEVALVNQTLAQQFWGRENVVGENVLTRIQSGSQIEIVGVLEDLSFEHPTAAVEPYIFRMSSTSGSLNAVYLIETAMPLSDLEQNLRALIDSGALEGSFGRVASLDDMRDTVIAPDRARGLLTIVTAALVVFLAALGFYGTQRYLVTAGRREYAIRASLGAGPRSLGRLVFSRGLLLSLPGLVIGTLGAFALVAWLRDAYVSRDISPTLVTLIVVAGLVLLLLGASLGPARKARGTQPAPLLREE